MTDPEARGVELVERSGRLIVSAPFNPAWREWARDHGGKCDAGSKAWTFRPDQRAAVEAALAEIFGENGDE